MNLWESILKLLRDFWSIIVSKQNVAKIHEKKQTNRNDSSFWDVLKKKITYLKEIKEN